MKMIRPEEKLPSNQVKFIISMEMSQLDVKNYLEKIYKVPVMNVSTYIQQGIHLLDWTFVTYLITWYNK